MITALFLGLIKTLMQGLYLALTTLLSAVFSNYTGAMASITGSTAMKVAAGIIDTVCGWSFFTSWVTLALIVLPLIRLGRYLIGLFTKG